MAATKSLEELQEEIQKLDSRYVLDRTIGAGSYGIVIRAHHKDDPTNLVAIKRVNKEIFDEFVLAKRILREIRLLAHFNDENIIGLRNILTPSNPSDFDHFYIVMDLMETDLKQVLRSGQILTEAHIQFFIYQTLRALLIIHRSGVIHRDITPANILVNTNCDLKICDFGLAKEESTQGEYMTDYVTMRWYRAPELVMEDKNYSVEIDVWGVGCILGELLGSRPLFQGTDRVNQLDKIVDLIGKPTEEDINSVGSAAAQKYIKKKADKPTIDWRRQYPKATEEALDLLKRMLMFNPKHRISVLEAMHHPFLSSLHDPADDAIERRLFTFDENAHKTVQDVKRAIYEESVKFHEKAMPHRGESEAMTSTEGSGSDVETLDTNTAAKSKPSQERDLPSHVPQSSAESVRTEAKKES